jgi:hypothetical protein
MIVNRACGYARPENRDFTTVKDEFPSRIAWCTEQRVCGETD